MSGAVTLADFSTPAANGCESQCDTVGQRNVQYQYAKPNTCMFGPRRSLVEDEIVKNWMRCDFLGRQADDFQ